MIWRDIKDSRASVRLFVIITSVIGICVFAYSLIVVANSSLSLEWLLLVLITLLFASRTNIQIPKIPSTIILDDTFIYVSVLLFGVAPSVVQAGMNALVYSLNYKKKRGMLPFNMAVSSLSISISATTAQYIFGEPRFYMGVDFVRLFLVMAPLALMHYVLSSGLVSVVSALSTRQSLIKTWQDSFLWTSLSYFAGALAAGLIVILITIVSFYAFIVSIPIIVITYSTYKVYLGKVETSMRHAEQMADLHLRTIEALALAIDAKDEVSPDHVHRVQIYATGLARLFELSEPEIEALKAGALLHDIGKLAVPDYILNKPGMLTPAEFDRMKVHTVVGAEILERVGFPYPVVPVVRHHHERWDGHGYPDHLRGDEIPITARIITIVDSFDSMREERQYRKAMTKDEAIAILRKGSGTFFDPNIVSVFLDHLNEFEEEIRQQKKERQEVRETERSLTNVKSEKEESRPVVFEHIRSAHREVITLYDIAQTIGTSLDLRDMFAVFSSRLQDIVSYTTCALYLHKPDTIELEAVHVSGRNAERLKGKNILLGSGITGWVAANRHPMYNSDPYLDFDAVKLDFNEKYQTAMCVPLMKDDEMLGALTLYSAELRLYTPDHLRMMEAVAKLASDAIANALHFERTEAKTLTDSLTGLLNAKALRQRFEVMADLARRHGDSLAVFVMDLDDFKKVNDQFGHKVGDQLIRDVAWLIHDAIHPFDFAFRYTDDQFIVLSEGNSVDFSTLSQRIQDTVGHSEVASGIHIGISIGYACLDTDAEMLDDLLAIAAAAMYIDKANRKCAALEESKPSAKNF